MTAIVTRMRGRAVPALATSACTSAAGLLVAVAVARSSTVEETGRFGVAAAATLLVAALARSAVTDPLVVDGQRPDRLRRLGRASLIGLIGALVIAVAAVALRSEFLAVGALAVHGLTLRECVRAVHTARGRARSAVLIEAMLVGAGGIALTGTLLGLWGGVVAFGIWALAGATLGYVAVVRGGFAMSPKWSSTPVPTELSLSYAGDTLVGSGVVQLVTWVATAIGGLSIAAALRGAGTLAGPVTVTLTAARSVLIPRAVAHLQTGAGVPRLALDTVFLCAASLPLLAALAVVPEPIGSALLGATWPFVAPVLALTAAELLFQLVAAVPEAAHRALGRGRRVLALRIGGAVVRVPVVVLAAPHGIVAVVLSAAVITLCNAIAWWASLALLERRQTR
ncbi:hypothetical protein ACO0E1_05895 [Curtobacterium sp. RRHDQ66]|uniref:hypothetical protein n=1 Tax=Curtobacterium guangdongense TaxID=3413380 RepID=UPI003BF241CA